MAHLVFPTALGMCGLAWNDAGLTAFALPARAGTEIEAWPWLAGLAGPDDPAVPLDAAPGWVRDLVVRVQRHLAGELQDFRAVPLDASCVSPKAWRVYQAARSVPAGQTRTYGDLAAMVADPAANARAIGALMGSNPWPLIVPCHRIVGARGRLTGFSAAGGVRQKARLLAIEGEQLIAE
ncbi:MAG TPA: methylated-DNA--[protein]-cysteine S-methyltransferase [Opitutaceae bacterium]|nr:methylated-DNA--[protein]-cysteine S-methyltransferase [Opitutaceae bacterium]